MTGGEILLSSLDQMGRFGSICIRKNTILLSREKLPKVRFRAYWELFHGMNTALPLRIAIVGCGDNGVRSASLLGDARLVVACDTNPRRAASLAATAHACYATNLLSEALSFLPDAVIVATPRKPCTVIAVEALRAGAHVFLFPDGGLHKVELEPVLAISLSARRLVGIQAEEGGEELPTFLDALRLRLVG